MTSLTVLALFLLVGVVDNLHCRSVWRRPGPDQATRRSYPPRCAAPSMHWPAPLRTRVEKTYSAPLAYQFFPADVGRAGRHSAPGIPRLKFGGASLKYPKTTRPATSSGASASGWRWRPWAGRRWRACWWRAWPDVAAGAIGAAWRAIWRSKGGLAWRSVRDHSGREWPADRPVGGAGGRSIACSAPTRSGRTCFPDPQEHPHGAGHRHSRPSSPPAGGGAGHPSPSYLGGWVDDAIQYIYTVLNSIPGVLLIAAAVLMMRVVIDTHPHWFENGRRAADARLLAYA